MIMKKFENILKQNNLDYLDYSEDNNIFEIEIPYNNTVIMSFISSFVGDLANNGFRVDTKFENGTVLITAISDSEYTIESSAAYYLVKRWASRINRNLQELEVLVEKDDKIPGKYGEDSTVYIMNPEINLSELDYIVDWFDGMGVEIPPIYLSADNIQYVRSNPWLQEQGYSNNETYLSFPVLKNDRPKGII